MMLAITKQFVSETDLPIRAVTGLEALCCKICQRMQDTSGKKQDCNNLGLQMSKNETCGSLVVF